MYCTNKILKSKFIFLVLALLLLLNYSGSAEMPGLAGQALAQEISWTPLINRLEADGFSRSRLEELFSGVEYSSAPMGDKMITLYRRKFGSGLVRQIQRKLDALGYQAEGADGYSGPKTRAAIRGFQKEHGLKADGQASEELLAHIEQQGHRAPAGYSPPAPPARRPGPTVYRSIITPERLAEATTFYKQNKPLLLKVRKLYGIPPEITVGLLTVETRVGTFLGDQNAFQTLASMARATTPALFSDYFRRESPQGAQLAWLQKRTRQKSDWAYAELKALLRYAQNKGADPRTLPCSIYGAIGISQFMPTNALKFGVDGDQDGVVNLFDVDDALFSMGNYLKKHGWKGDTTTVRQQRRALYNYNHSTIYVNTIMAVAEHLRQSGS